MDIVGQSLVGQLFFVRLIPDRIDRLEQRAAVRPDRYASEAELSIGVYPSNNRGGGSADGSMRSSSWGHRRRSAIHQRQGLGVTVSSRLTRSATCRIGCGSRRECSFGQWRWQNGSCRRTGLRSVKCQGPGPLPTTGTLSGPDAMLVIIGAEHSGLKESRFPRPTSVVSRA